MPSSWKEQALSSVVKSPISYGVVQTGEPVKNGVPCVRVVDIASGDLNPKHMITTTREISNSYKRTILETGDVIMALRGVIGRSALVSEPLEQCNLTRGVARISLNRTVASPTYVFQFLNAPQFQSYIGRQANGSALQEISIATLRKAKVSLPPLQEQRRIAEILSTWDRAIDATEKLIANSEAQKKALMQQLLTGRKRLPGFHGEWKKVRLGDCANCLDNQRVPLNGEERASMKGDIPYYGANGVVDHIDKHIFDQELVLLAEDGGYFDEFASRPIAQFISGKSWVNNHAHILSAKPVTSEKWLYFSLVHKNILAFINGGTRAKLNKSDMLSIPILLPPKEEQMLITQILDNAANVLECLGENLLRSKREKAVLMQQLLTGKRRVAINKEEAVV